MGPPVVAAHANGSGRALELTDPASGRLVHLPALDGLRGLAVAGVVAFHAGFERMVGGYLGVSTFFTLSGFLITSLLVAEARRSGAVSLRRFWARRFRRLLPAALVTLFLVTVLFGPFVATPDQLAALPGDVLTSLADVVNWHFILAGSSYGQLFAAPSPVLHFWSLSIEEQCYVVVPLLVVGVWVASRGRRRALALVLAGLAAVLTLEPWLLDLSVDRVYFGTDTRAPELLLGALLAVLLSYKPWRRRLVRRSRWRRTAAAAGTAALVLQLWWWWTLPQSTPWLYRGGFALYAVLTCLVLTAATLPRGPLVAALSVRPLRYLGSRSYGIYLVHWPLFLAARQLFPDLPRAAATVLVVATSLLLAELSLRLVEHPVRFGHWPRPGRALPVAAGAMAVVAVAALLPWPGEEPVRTTDFEQAQDAFQQMGRSAQVRGPGGATTTVPPAGGTSGAGGPVSATVPVPAQPPVVGFFGDSTALGVGMGYDAWLKQQGAPVRVVGDAELGCGVSRFDRRRDDTVVELSPKCAAWPDRWGKVVDAERPDVAVLMSSVWEIADAQLPGSGRWTAIGDPATDDFIRQELTRAVDVLARDGALVLLMTWPEYGTWADDGRPDAVSRQTQPERMQRMHQIMQEVAAERPEDVRVLDFAAWFGDRAQDRRWRADGTHFLFQDFAVLAPQWFAPEIDRLWQDWARDQGR